MCHSGSCGHALKFALPDNGTISHAVFMLQLALNDIGNDFHIFMRVGAKALARLDPVFIDHP